MVGGLGTSLHPVQPALKRQVRVKWRLCWPLCSWTICEIIRGARPYLLSCPELVTKEECQWRLSDVIPVGIPPQTVMTVIARKDRRVDHPVAFLNRGAQGIAHHPGSQALDFGRVRLTRRWRGRPHQTPWLVPCMSPRGVKESDGIETGMPRGGHFAALEEPALLARFAPPPSSRRIVMQPRVVQIAILYSRAQLSHRIFCLLSSEKGNSKNRDVASGYWVS